MDGLGGGLVGAAGPGDHGGVGGLSVKALRLLGGPHDDDFGNDAGLSARNAATYKTPRWPPVSTSRRRLCFIKAHFVPRGAGSGWRGKTNKQKKKKNLTDHFFFFTATPRGDGRGQCAVTLRAGKSGCCPSERDPAAFFLLRTASRPSAIGALVTMLGGSLVSLHRGRFWGSLSSTEEEESTTGLRDASPRDRERERERENIHPSQPRRTESGPRCFLL